MRKEPTDNRRGAWMMLAIMLSIIVIYLCIAYISEHYITSEQDLIEYADEQNGQCPLTETPSMQLLGVTVLPEMLLQFRYRLMEVNINEVDTTTLRSTLIKTVRQQIASNSELHSFHTKNVTLQYHFQDKNQAHLFLIVLKPEQKN